MLNVLENYERIKMTYYSYYERIIENLQEQTKLLFKVVDKLEQRISTLEKVLDSHAKCIGELREDKNDIL